MVVVVSSFVVVVVVIVGVGVGVGVVDVQVEVEVGSTNRKWRIAATQPMRQ